MKATTNAMTASTIIRGVSGVFGASHRSFYMFREALHCCAFRGKSNKIQGIIEVFKRQRGLPKGPNYICDHVHVLHWFFNLDLLQLMYYCTKWRLSKYAFFATFKCEDTWRYIPDVWDWLRFVFGVCRYYGSNGAAALSQLPYLDRLVFALVAKTLPSFTAAAPMINVHRWHSGILFFPEESLVPRVLKSMCGCKCSGLVRRITQPEMELLSVWGHSHNKVTPRSAVRWSLVKWENWGKCLQADGKFKFFVNFRSWTNGKHIFPFVQCLHQSMQLMDKWETNFPICPSYEQSLDEWITECIKETLVIFSNV